MMIEQETKEQGVMRKIAMSLNTVNGYILCKFQMLKMYKKTLWLHFKEYRQPRA